MEDSRTITTTPENENSAESSSLDKLFAGLAKAQIEMCPAKKTTKAHYGKFADLASVVEASRKALGNNGLSVIQRILRQGSAGMTLLTRLCHASGQWIESSMTVNPPKQDIQSLGSYLTYLRRYTYSSIVGVVVSGEDDDGEAAIGRGA